MPKVDLSNLRKRLDQFKGVFKPVSNTWLIHGDPKKEKAERTVSDKVLSSRLKKTVAWQESKSKKQVLRRGRGLIEGGNAGVYFNKKRGHVLKVFKTGTAGDNFNGTNKTLKRTLNYCAGFLGGRTFADVDLEIKKVYEKLNRIRSKNLDPSSFDPSPVNLIEQLKRKREELLVSQKNLLTSAMKNGFNSLAKNNFIPFVYSVRIPRIFSEKRVASGEYVVSMEFVKGPTLSGLLEAIEGRIETRDGKNGLDFVKKNNLDNKELHFKISAITTAINQFTSRQGGSEYNTFIPRMDSFIVEGIDKQGNLKLVLVDNA